MQYFYPTLVNSGSVFNNSNGEVVVTLSKSTPLNIQTPDPSLINSGLVFNNSNGNIVVTFPSSSTLNVESSDPINALPITVDVSVICAPTGGGGGGGVSRLKDLIDVVGANSGANGYVLQIDNKNTANTADDTYNFVKNDFDAGEF